MSLFQATTLHFQRSSSPLSASAVPRVEKSQSAVATFPCPEEISERIIKLFHKVELSVSSYDTAWVAMVPSHFSNSPCFPQCVDWLLDNQLPDGSWGLPHYPVQLVRDTLSSTLASVLALKRWGVGEEQINKGVRFIELNFASATDDNQYPLIGFNIIFPGMLDYAKDLDLNLHLEQRTVNALLKKRDLELRRYYERRLPGEEAYLAYVSEGLGKFQDWNLVMKYQRKNGSLFNSPSTTAAALTHIQNSGCLDYLHSVLQKFGNAVPTVYPLDIYARLCLVDNLEGLGISHYFQKEIRDALDETYRCWLQGEEEIFMDASTCALAFRLLRKDGYDVSSDKLCQILEQECLFNSFGGHLKDINATIETYRASEMIIHPDESALEKHNLCSKHFLEQKLSDGSLYLDTVSRHIHREVENILKVPSHATLERVATRRNIEHYSVDNSRTLKTLFW